MGNGNSQLEAIYILPKGLYDLYHTGGDIGQLGNYMLM